MGNNADKITAAISAHHEMMIGLSNLSPQIDQAATRMIKALHDGGKILWMGNGGSASDCQHLAAELVGRYTRDRKGIPSIALTTDTSILTAVSNDYGFESIFARQIEALCSPNDVVVGLSTSGNSPNILAGLKQARDIGAYTVGLTGRDGGQLVDLVDTIIVVSAKETSRIQEGHILIGHILCDIVEEEFAAR